MNEKPKGSVKTTINICPTNNEFLQIKRNLIKRLVDNNINYNFDDVKLEHRYYSRDDIFNKKHQWDGIGIIFSLGLIIPFLLPKFFYDSYEYYNSEDCYFIDYDIKFRKLMLLYKT